MLNVERGKGKGTRMAREGNRKDSTWLNSLATLEKENHSRQKFLRISNNPEWIAICGSRVSQLVKTFLHLGFSPKMRPFLLSFFLSLSLFPSSSFFPSPPRDSTACVGCNARFITRCLRIDIGGKLSPIPLRIPVYGFFPSSFLFVSAIHILSAVRNEQSFSLFNELVSAVFVFYTHLSCLFDKVSNSYRPYSSVERAWFYLHPCWTARPIFGRDDNFKRLPSRVLAGTINEIPQRAAGSINKLLLLYIRPATFPLFST